MRGLTHKLTWITVLVAALAGCAASTTSSYGNFAQNFPAISTTIADDAMRQLVALYPPASTQLNLKQQATDGFGLTLIDGLRAKGYAVVESPEGGRALAKEAEDGSSARSTKINSVDLRYVLDHLGEDLYRITIIVGDRSLTRAYIQQGESVVPAGAWLRKE